MARRHDQRERRAWPPPSGHDGRRHHRGEESPHTPAAGGGRFVTSPPREIGEVRRARADAGWSFALLPHATAYRMRCLLNRDSNNHRGAARAAAAVRTAAADRGVRIDPTSFPHLRDHFEVVEMTLVT